MGAENGGSFGGGGSVRWKIDVEDADTPDLVKTDRERRGRAYRVDSVDGHGGVGEFFEVTILVPPDGDLRYRVDGGRVQLYLRIGKAGDPYPQIRVGWALPEQDVPADARPFPLGTPSPYPEKEAPPAKGTGAEDPLQSLIELSRRLVALLRLLGKQALHHVLERLRPMRGKDGQRHRIFFQHVGDRF